MVIVVPVVIMTAVAVLVFVQLLDPSSPTGRLELIRTSLAVGAGTGAIMTLVLAWRRQWSTEHDAAERRLTDLYVKAVEQLGSDKAPVRHGALYALERVAQDNPDHRQTVVNVLCAYLRAPYTPPPDPPVPRQTGLPAPSRGTPATRVAATTAAARRTSLHPPTPPPTPEDLRQEREVRLTAQRILSRHLHPGNRPRRPVHTFWPDIDLDLTDATLIDLDLSGCHIGTARFAGARFTGDARFGEATFNGVAWFERATFTKLARFVGARFTGAARFAEATFNGDARFIEATFNEITRFAGARFTGDTRFDRATFTETVGFNEVTFTGATMFNQARFTGDALFDEAKFTGILGFLEAKFTGDARFGEATFSEAAWFDRATFTGDAWFNGTRFTGAARFAEATFTGDAWFRPSLTGGVEWPVARFEQIAVMTGAKARRRQSTWLTGWTTADEFVVTNSEGNWFRLVPVPATLPSEGDDPTEAAE
ncbi:pentapeptide repeat-containing protein [Amycolatopsis magusensis]|uniref:pentapeptide repeat-containing protein n=1 Tax=Amycolatopsis magusensis TaxID=882444 RepID=UPI0037A104DA